MVETMRIDRFLAEPERVDIVSQNIFSRYKDKLGAAVGVSLHMGNWELAILPFTWAGANPAAVYRSVTNPYVDRYLRAQRKDLYPDGLFGRGNVGEHGDDQKTARAIMDFVRRGGRLGLVCDLYDRTGMPVPFFGKDAKTQAIGAMIARRRRRAHLAVAGQAHRHVEPLPDRAQGIARAAHGQSGRGHPLDHDPYAGAIRGMDPRRSGAMDVEQPALELAGGDELLHPRRPSDRLLSRSATQLGSAALLSTDRAREWALMDVVLTLSDVHPRDRLAYWYDVACKVFVDHECRVTTPAQFDVTMQHMALSDLGVVNIESLGLGFAEVTARTIANGEDDVFFLCLQLEGGATLS